MDPVVILANDTVSAGPGGEARLQVRVRNQGRRVESYAVEVVGAPARFAQVEPANVSVLPGKEAEVTITFRPPVGASTPTGVLPFAVRAVSEVGSSSSAVAEGRLELAGAAGLQAWADATTAAGRWSGQYRLWFSNQGNAPARLFIGAHDASAAMRLTVRDEVLSVPPGAQVDTEITAKARQPFLRGSAVNRIITASCQDFPFGAERPVPGQAPPRDDPNHRTFQLTFQQKPIVSKLVLALAGLVIVGVVGLALWRLQQGGDTVALGFARPDAPSTFTAEPAGSTAIFLTWGPVPNAAGYDIRETTADGQATGPVLQHLDGATFKHTVEGLEPGETKCYAVQATGPEDVESSQPSASDCATTTATPTLAAPTNFQATETSPGTYDVRWDEMSVEGGVTFTVFLDNDPLKPDVDGFFTTVVVPQRDQSFDATLKVKAVSPDQTSEPSNAVPIVVEALAPAVESTAPGTTVAGGGGGVPGGGGGGGGTPTTAAGQGGGGTPTTAPDGATTTAPTTTVATPPAPSEIQDVDQQWVAWLGAVQPVPIGPGEERQRNDLATAFNVGADRILTFSNRDTDARDALDAADTDVANAGPEDEFFYVEQANQTAAAAFCGTDLRCRPMTIQGAAKRAEGTSVRVLRRLPATTSLAALDQELTTLRADLVRPQIYVLDAAVRDQFGTPELLVFASGFPDAPAGDAFCTTNGLPPARCAPVDLVPEP